MAKVEVASLRVALLKQCIIIKKLYDELEEERNASATAASEALSMILRLEREKSTERMEASQYKRMSEEKMQHIEESLEMLEDLMRQKDGEISLLNYQLQTCQHKLLSFGVKIPDPREVKIYRSPSLSGRSASTNKIVYGCVRRNTSLPSLKIDKMDLSDDGSLLAEHPILRESGDYTNQLSEMGEETQILDFYEESVKQAEVNKKLKVLMQATINQVKAERESALANNERQSSSVGKVPTYLVGESSSGSLHSTIDGAMTKLHGEGVSYLSSQVEHPEDIPEGHTLTKSLLEARINRSLSSSLDVTSSLDVHDIFEIPESDRVCRTIKPYKEVLKDPIPGMDFKMADLLPQEAIDYIFSDDNWLNMQFMSVMPKPREGSFVHHTNKLSRPQPSVNCNSMGTGPESRNNSPLSNVEQLRKRLQKLEDGTQEGSDTSEEQLQLLQEMNTQLDTIESHLKDSYKKLPSQDESSVVSVMEAVLSFSI